MSLSTIIPTKEEDWSTDSDSNPPPPEEVILSEAPEKPTPKWWRFDNAPWEKRSNFGIVRLLSGNILVVGGQGDAGVFGVKLFADVWKLNWETKEWKCVNPCALFGPRGNMGIAVMPNGAIVVAGGESNERRLSSVYISKDEGCTWQYKTFGAPWGPRSGHQLVCTTDSGTLILMGGNTNSLSDIWKSTDSGESWYPVEDVRNFCKRSHFGAVILFSNRIVVAGGVWRGTIKCDNSIYSDDEGKTWETSSEDIGSSRSHLGMAKTDDDESILMVGGMTESVYHPSLLKNFRVSNDSGETWFDGGDAEIAHARCSLGVVSCGGDMIMVMGGKDDESYFNDVWVYS